MSTPAVSVIIPAWNLWEMTRACLESLARHTPPELVELVVVDNGSTDETREALEPVGRKLFGERFRAVRLEENLGFAKGCNAGARAAAADRLFFLNNDTLATEGWLPPLLAALDGSPFLGMVGPLLLLPGARRVQHCGIAFAPTLEVEHMYGFFPGNHPLVRRPRIWQALTGAALLLSAELFRRCGGFCEGYRNGFEDLDLCCAVRRTGLCLGSVPQSVLFHLTSQTPGRFDHDGPNTRLLNERCPGGFVPDLHRVGMEDGFVPALSPALELYLTLPSEREAALTDAFSRAFDADRCRLRLLAEPLWRGGYTLLAGHLERVGTAEALAEALDWRSLQVRFFPLAEHAAALARTAARAGDAAMAENAVQATADLRATAADAAALHEKADALARWGRNAGDAVLAGLYADWLRRAQEAETTTPRE